MEGFWFRAMIGIIVLCSTLYSNSQGTFLFTLRGIVGKLVNTNLGSYSLPLINLEITQAQK